jgi:hypothetical protein
MWEKLAKDPYFRAGAFGAPFCLVGIMFTHRPVFLFGIVFLQRYFFRVFSSMGRL